MILKQNYKFENYIDEVIHSTDIQHHTSKNESQKRSSLVNSLKSDSGATDESKEFGN